MLQNIDNVEGNFDITAKISEFTSNDVRWGTKIIDAGTYNHRKFRWLVINFLNGVTPQSGWKFHISASLFNAKETLEAVLPTLISFPFTFKVTSNLDFLAFLNNSNLSQNQVGKFITIYPNDTVKAIKLIETLHEKTKFLKSPKVITDFQYVRNSNIYYRYGAFYAKYEQSLWGALLPIMEVNGIKTFDFKKLDADFYQELENPFNPIINSAFLNKGDKKKIESFKNGTLIKCYRLFHTGSSETLLCIDIEKKRRCIIKMVDINTATDSLGNDSVQRLKIEESILKKLHSTGISPKFYDSFYDKSQHYCLVIEDFPGDTLHEYLLNHITLQHIIPIEKFVRIAIDLAEKMAFLHKEKIIHADLKLSNLILLETGEIKLIDFDSACDFSENKLISTCGSTGFCTKNRERGLTPRFSDDIYSYGAILYYLFGFINPNICPLEIEQNEVSLELFNNSTPNYILYVVNFCLKKQFESFTEIVNILKQKNHLKSDKILIPIQPQIYSNKLEFLVKEYLYAAYNSQEDLFNFSQTISGNIETTDLRGLSGSLLSLSVSAIAGLNSDHNLNLAIQKSATKLLHESLPYNSIPGLYVGEAGKALSLLYASKALDDNSLNIKARAFMKEINKMPFLSVDLFNGISGRIRTNLIFWLITKDLIFINTAKKMVTHLIKVRKYHDGFIAWHNPSSQSTAEDFQLDNELLLGYAHGVAGIGDALLDYYILTKEIIIKQILNEIITCLIQKAQTTMHGKGYEWPDGYNGKAIASYWCHGGAGIGLFICRAMYYKVIESDKSLINKILNPITSFTKNSAPILCHGILGSLESLLDFYQYFPELKNNQLIHIFECILSVWLRTYINHGFKTCNAQFAFYGYMTGVPGIVSVYSRLACPIIPNPLHLEFANYLLSKKKI